MKKFKISKKFVVVSTLLLMIAVGCSITFTELTLPSDASSDCNSTITAPIFNSWFTSGSVSLNGAVNPANSVTFSPNSLCSFYAWSEQMFLWLTSPAPKTYGGGGGLVVNSPAFYDVSPEDSLGNRTFIAHQPGLIRAFNVRTAQHGPHDLPVIMEKKTLRLLEILNPVISKTGKQLIQNGNGQAVEIGRAIFDKNKKPVFFDTKGVEIVGAKALIQSDLEGRSKLANPQVSKISEIDRVDLVQKFNIGRIPVFLDLNGNVIETEQGQADGSVLMAQNGSLVYFITIANDVYAYFRTMQGTTVPFPSPVQFPTTPASLHSVTSFAAAHGKTLVDSNAMAIEVKSSWVEAAGLPDSNKFITMEAVVPTYDKTNPNDWKPNGHKTVLLAMVGMHVVGSVNGRSGVPPFASPNGHPEMLWGSFEHVSNTPDTTYDYTKASGTGNVPMNTSGNWVFCSNNASSPFNFAHMVDSSNDIVPVPGFTISPSNTLRVRPFGMPGSDAASNAEIITINNSVRSMLVAGDLRANYFQLGTIWTPGGAPATPTNGVGTSNLANSTMETYQLGSNCFDCHNSNTTDVSHVFSAIKPLF